MSHHLCIANTPKENAGSKAGRTSGAVQPIYVNMPSAAEFTKLAAGESHKCDDKPSRQQPEHDASLAGISMISGQQS